MDVEALCESIMQRVRVHKSFIGHSNGGIITINFIVMVEQNDSE